MKITGGDQIRLNEFWYDLSCGDIELDAFLMPADAARVGRAVDILREFEKSLMESGRVDDDC